MTTTLRLSQAFWLDASPIFDDATGYPADGPDSTLVALSHLVEYQFSPIPLSVLADPAVLAALRSEVQYRLESCGWHDDVSYRRVNAALEADLRRIEQL
jgi:hypothetical protein